jgi:hypothetical protein
MFCINTAHPRVAVLRGKGEGSPGNPWLEQATFQTRAKQLPGGGGNMQGFGLSWATFRLSALVAVIAAFVLVAADAATE